MARLTRIYTRTGDDGTTGLADGDRVAKDSERIDAMGDIDELNSLLGVLRSSMAMHPRDASETSTLAQRLPDIDRLLLVIQHHLFDIGGELALPGHDIAKDDWVKRLEDHLDGLNAHLPPLQEFVLPGGNLAAAHCHQARTVCRRAERGLLRLSRSEAVNSASLKYLNRLSDLLFVIARTLARMDGGKEITWQKGIET